MIETIANWIAPVATIIAACMTAANLGSRVTGWGFVVFTIGSIAWLTIGVATGQTSLLVANGFLLLANAVGIYRWLWRQAKYEDGSKVATARSERRPVATLFAASAVIGAELIGREGVAIATVVDGMLRCDGRDLSYLVVSDNGVVAGVGERLFLLDPALVTFGPEGMRVALDSVADLPEVVGDDWPAALPATARAA